MILIALGSNLPSAAGPPAQTIAAALATLKRSGITLVKVSRLYSSAAWPDPADPSFVNTVAQVTTTLQPYELLESLHGIEESFGRVRGARNAPRTLDMDILDYNGRIECGPPALPHPRLEGRPFVLVPLAEIAPAWWHPVLSRTAAELLAALPGQGDGVAPLCSTNAGAMESGP